MKEKIIGIIALIALSVSLHAETTMRCEGRLIGTEDDVSMKIKYELPHSTSKIVQGSVIFKNENSDVDFKISCLDNLLRDKENGRPYFICTPRETYLNLRVIVFPDSKQVALTDSSAKRLIGDIFICR